KLYTYDLIEPGDVEVLKSRLSILRKSGNLPSLQVNAITKSGRLIPVEINSQVIDYEGKKVVLSIVRDIRERREIQRRILNTIIETEEKERSRFAKDLHDGLGPLLSTTKLYIKALSTIDDPGQKEIAITNSQIAIDEAISSIKEIANNISPHILRNFGLVAALNSYVNKINDTKEIMLDFEANLNKRLDENCELSLFRIIIELINNTLKYAKAKKASISLNKRKRLVMLDYSDDGVGFDVEKQLNEPAGRGLLNIVNRTKTLNGKIIFNSEKGKGFNVKIEIVPNN
ncbi:MAG: PAS domain S-box protein, partial [Candidatus Heimdallarchaeota archaeon]|nr:PAS domain S-box protein [Candidatus Heimdallarchaeota archaeon]